MITELIEFRLFRMPCCKQLLCWVNPRLPNRCPECGERVYQQLRTQPEMLNRPETTFSRAYNFDQLCLPNFGRTPWTGKIVSKSKARAVITSGLDIMDPFYVLYLTQDLVVWSRQIGPSPTNKQVFAQNRERLVSTLIGWMGW